MYLLQELKTILNKTVQEDDESMTTEDQEKFSL